MNSFDSYGAQPCTGMKDVLYDILRLQGGRKWSDNKL